MKVSLWLPWAVIGSSALALRLIYLFEMRHLPFVESLVGDAATYDAWSMKIAEGAWLGDAPFYQAPLYPYFLACIYVVIGHSVWAIRIVQCVLGSVACLLVGSAGCTFISRRAGLTSAALLAIYPPAVYFDGIIQKSSVAFFLMSLVLWLIASFRRAGCGQTVVLMGVALGCLCLTRENALALIPVVAVWLLVGAKSVEAASIWKRVSSVGWFVVGLGVTLLPVGFRNQVVGGEFSVTTFQAGPNFYMGNHEGADGRYSPLIPGRETPEYERTDATELAEKALGKKLSVRQVSDYWMDRSVDYIRNRPADWLRLTWTKWWLTWNRYEIPDTESYYIYRDGSRLLSVLGRVWHFGVLCPLAVVGVVVTWSDRRRLAILYALIWVTAISVTAFYVFGRYRFPLVPLIVVFASAGAWGLIDRVSICRWKGLAIGTCVGGVAAVWVNWPINPERMLNAGQLANLGAVLAENGKLGEAVPYFRRAVAALPGAPRPRQFLADALSMTGQYSEAIAHYEVVLRLDPTRANVSFNLAVAYEAVGRWEDALGQYRRVIASHPDDFEAQRAIQRLEERLQKPG